MTKKVAPRQLSGMVQASFDVAAIFPRSESAVSADTGCIQAFEQELDYLCRTLRRLGTPPTEVEDLAHEVFLVLNRNWARYDRERSLRAYLFGIAFRVTAAHNRRLRREVPSETIADHADDAPHPEGNLAAKEARALVLRGLEAVPPARRAVLILHDLDELPMREIAKTLSIPLFTGYSRLRKARRELQTAIEGIRNEERMT